MEVSIGNLIDQLSIVNLKIFKWEDLKRTATGSDKELADATRNTNILNQQRNNLIQAIDEYFGKNTGQGSTKSYG